MNKIQFAIKNVLNKFDKIKIFYSSRNINYWDSITPCQIEGPVETIGKYYLDFSSKFYYPNNFSKTGIPLFQISHQKEIFNPTVICQYALGIFQLLNHPNHLIDKLKLQFYSQADWLIENQQKLINGYGWYLNYDIPEYRLKSPWISALTQGEAISVLCRAYLLSKDVKYLKSAENALIPFEFSVYEGGLFNYFNNIKIFEEYPSEKPNIVLNGFIFAMFGFYDLYLSNSNTSAKKLFDIGIDSLEKLINYFDAKYWSQYNLYYYPKQYLASFKYHRLHIEQLKALFLISGKELFEKYFLRWENYQSSLFIKNKVLMKKLLKL